MHRLSKTFAACIHKVIRLDLDEGSDQNKNLPATICLVHYVNGFEHTCNVWLALGLCLVAIITYLYSF